MGERNRKGPLPQKWRDSIRSGVLIKRLKDHACGKAEMTSTQIQAARILLSKTLPDLKAVDHSGDSGVTINVVSPVGRPDTDT